MCVKSWRHPDTKMMARQNFCISFEIHVEINNVLLTFFEMWTLAEAATTFFDVLRQRLSYTQLRSAFGQQQFYSRRRDVSTESVRQDNQLTCTGQDLWASSGDLIDSSSLSYADTTCSYAVDAR